MVARQFSIIAAVCADAPSISSTHYTIVPIFVRSTEIMQLEKSENQMAGMQSRMPCPYARTEDSERAEQLRMAEARENGMTAAH